MYFIKVNNSFIIESDQGLARETLTQAINTLAIRLKTLYEKNFDHGAKIYIKKYINHLDLTKSEIIKKHNMDNAFLSNSTKNINLVNYIVEYLENKKDFWKDSTAKLVPYKETTSAHAKIHNCISLELEFKNDSTKHIIEFHNNGKNTGLPFYEKHAEQIANHNLNGIRTYFEKKKFKIWPHTAKKMKLKTGNADISAFSISLENISKECRIVYDWDDSVIEVRVEFIPIDYFYENEKIKKLENILNDYVYSLYEVEIPFISINKENITCGKFTRITDLEQMHVNIDINLFSNSYMLLNAFNEGMTNSSIYTDENVASNCAIFTELDFALTDFKKSDYSAIGKEAETCLNTIDFFYNLGCLSPEKKIDAKSAWDFIYIKLMHTILESDLEIAELMRILTYFSFCLVRKSDLTDANSKEKIKCSEQVDNDAHYLALNVEHSIYATRLNEFPRLEYRRCAMPSNINALMETVRSVLENLLVVFSIKEYEIENQFNKEQENASPSHIE